MELTNYLLDLTTSEPGRRSYEWKCLGSQHVLGGNHGNWGQGITAAFFMAELVDVMQLLARTTHSENLHKTCCHDNEPKNTANLPYLNALHLRTLIFCLIGVYPFSVSYV